MRSTLFFIPHEILGIPLFGLGWALGLILLAAVAWLIVQLRARRTPAEIVSGGLFWLVAIPLVMLILPSVEQRWPDGTPIGLPIRGYGVMVLTGLLIGVFISNIRAVRLGINLDTIIGLGIWLMLGGVIGARLFFVIQKWNEFEGEGLARLISILKLTEGGLVIYGGIFGGLAAGLWYCYRHHLSPLATADLIVPGFLIGYSFGRIGCLLHGCCFGGVCQVELPTIQFPPGSAAYQRQIEDGRLLGIHTSRRQLPAIVKSIEADSPAEKAGIRTGDELRAIEAALVEPDSQSSPTSPPPIYVKIQTDNSTRQIFPDAMPARSLPVHPSQIYASINALLLCVLMWLWQPIPKRDGIVFCTAIILYALSRFLIEWIRSDELGLFGTPFSIAQFISIACAAVGGLGLLFLRQQPLGRAWKWC